MKTPSAVLAALSLAAAASGQVLINEFLPNPSGIDPAVTVVELRGTPGASFTGFVLTLDADTSQAGEFNDQDAISGVFDANGILAAGVNDFQNPSFTLIITDSDVQSLGVFDFDADDDGAIDDISLFGTVYDAVNISDNGTDPEYADDFGGTNLGFTGDDPGVVFRDRFTLDWFAINDPFDGSVFDADGVEVDPGVFDRDVTGPGFNTLGAENPTLAPTPGAAGLVSLAAVVVARRRRG